MSDDRLPWPAHRVHTVEPAPPGVTRAALAGTTIVYATDTALYAASTSPPTTARQVLALAWPTTQLDLSPSARYALVRSQKLDQVLVVDLATGATSSFVDNDPRRIIVAGFAGDRDVLLVARTDDSLEMVELPAGTVLARASFRKHGFRFEQLLPIAGSDTVMAIGHLQGEGKDSLLTVSLPEMLADPDAAGSEFRRRRGPHDYTYQLTVGPCGGDAIVVHRDDEDDDPEPEPDDDPVDHLVGFYVRRLPHGELVELIPDSYRVEVGAPVFATEEYVVVGGAGEIRFVPRAGAGAVEPATLAAAVYALDAAGRRALTVDDDGRVAVYELA